MSRKSTHGHLRGYGSTPEYRSWTNMISRCTLPSSPSFVRYGARGITVCARWRASFSDFLADMGPRPEGHSIDRIDSAGNYEPGNCRWATRSEQEANKPSALRIEGVTMVELAQRVGLERRRLYERWKWAGRPQTIVEVLALAAPKSRGRHTVASPC